MDWIAKIVTIAFGVFALSANAQTYQDVAQQKNLNVQHSFPFGFSSGVSAVDFNGDGLDDVSLATQFNDSIWFYQNTGSGFIKIPPLVVNISYSHHPIWVDYDNDGDLDLYLSSVDQENKLYRNDSVLGFIDVTSASGLESSNLQSYGATWGDYNNDGWLDLYQCNRSGKNFLHMSDGAGGFIDQSNSSNVAEYDRLALAAVFFDLNNDGLQDLFVGNDKGEPTELYLNNGDSTFTEISVSAGVHVSMDAMCATVGDFDYDGFLDLYVTNTPQGNKLFRNNGNETFTEMADSLGVAYRALTWAASFFDYDNDGDLDLYVSETYQSFVNGSRATYPLFENTGNSFQQDTLSGFAGDSVSSYAHALGDFNQDGYLDIVSPNKFPDSLQLWESSGGANNWLKVKLEGMVSNRNAIGSWIECYAGAAVQYRYITAGSSYLSQHSFTKTFGLDTLSSVDSLKVKWLSGHTDVFYELSAGRVYDIREGSGINPELNLQGDTVFCSEDSIGVFLETKGNYTQYAWNDGDTNSSRTITQAGHYYLVVTNSLGLSDTTKTVNVRVDSLSLSATVQHDSLSSGRGKITIHVQGGSPPFFYKWDSAYVQNDSVADGLHPGEYTARVRDARGCRDSLVVRVEDPLGLSDQSENGISLFPNPSLDFIEIAGLSGATYHYRIINSTGQTVMESSLAPPYRIGLKELPGGIYRLWLSEQENPGSSVLTFQVLAGKP